jgi:hypothetical protein
MINTIILIVLVLLTIKFVKNIKNRAILNGAIIIAVLLYMIFVVIGINFRFSALTAHFFSGYLQENVISKKELNLIPCFLRLREMIVFTGCLKKWDFNNLSQWQEDFYNQSKKRIKNRVSIIAEEVISSEKIMNLKFVENRFRFGLQNVITVERK